MKAFADLIAQLMEGSQESEAAAGQGMAAFGKKLAAVNEIRFYVDGTANFGHQATTIHILKRLVDVYRYNKKIRVIYQDGTKAPTTPEKLALLLAGLDPRVIETTTIAYGTCPDITFLNLKQISTLTTDAEFGFTGGADDEGANLAVTLRTRVFLRLQPFLWRRQGPGSPFVANRIEFLDGRTAVDLVAISKTFPLLPYKYPPSTLGTVPKSVWNWYSTQEFNPALAARTKNALALAQAAGQAEARIWPVYGLHQFAPRDVLLNILLTGLCFQRDYRSFGGPPIILTLINDSAGLALKDSEWAQFITLFSQGDTKAITEILLEQNTDPNFGKQTAQRRAIAVTKIGEELAALAAELKPKETVVLLTDGVVTPQVIEEAVAKLTPGQVLILPLGSVAQEIYVGLYGGAEMPGIFEGQATSSVPISLGKPYLQTPKEGSPGANYPSVLITEENYEREASALNWSSERLRVSFRDYITEVLSAREWSYSGRMGAIAEVIDDCYTDSDLAEYFEELGQFYGEDVHDKLMLGLVGLNFVLEGASEQQLRRLLATPRAALAAADPGAGGTPLTLEQVYQSLVSTWSDGSVDLLAALPGSYLAGFYGAIMGAKLPVQVAKDDIAQEKDGTGAVVAVTLRNGATGAFGTPFGMELDFTAELGIVVSEMRCRSPETWGIDGVPWMGFERPGFSMRVKEAPAPVQGGAVGTVKGTPLTVEFRYPVQPSRWLVTGTLAPPYPGIGTFYAMAGGINLVQSLPAPLNTLPGFGLQQAQVLYNTAGSIDYLLFRMTTDAEWVFLNDPKMSITPTVQAVITNPGSLADRRTSFVITGAFTLGGGTITVSAQYPDFQVNAALTAGVIDLSDLARLFGVEVDLRSEVVDFTLFLQPPTSAYTVGSTLTADWPISIGGQTIFTITGLGFNVQGGLGVFQVSLSGSVIILPDDPLVALGISLNALYRGSGQGWLFSGTQTTGQVPLGELLKTYLHWDTGQALGIDGLGLTLDTATSSWTFTGKTAQPWSVPFLADAQLSASLTAGYKTTDPVTVPAASAPSAGSVAAPGSSVAGPFGRLNLEVTWHNIKIVTWFDYNPSVNSYGITWGILEGVVSGPDPVTQDWTATLRFRESVTLGSMIEEMISWLTGSRFGLEAPWSVLNNIPLNGLALNYTFNKTDSKRNKVTFSIGIGPIDLGFARIDSIDVGYESAGDNKGVNVKLVGSFIWNTGASAIGDTSTLGPWDASKPGAAPAPPGQGNKYLDLRMLAMGQHVTADCFPTSTTVQKAIECMGSLPPTEPGKLPAIRFDAESSWLIGADFGVLRLDPEEGGGGGGGGGQKLAAAEAGGPVTSIPLSPGTVAGLAAGEPVVTVGTRGTGYVNGVAASAELSARASADVSASPDAGALAPREPIGGVRLMRGPGGVPALALAGMTEAAPAAAEGSKYFINLQVVFNDPRLYGLRIALDGAPAKIFKGLDFQIMYRQVSDTVGVYQAEITLPDVMRHLSIGVYSITLPVFGIAVYTNGDFMLDVGFPWNEDFSRSFTIEGIIYPGIPVLGSAGFYFGKLSSATTDRVPKAINGTFNPVIVFGFGMQVGFGKSVNYGILSAGFSLTVVGILEGVIAKWNPYAVTAGGGGDVTQVQGAYYFWLRGTVGIVGKLYGSVDFAIVKADVNVTLKLLLQLTYESFVSITITVIASVDVAVSVKIDLGLFSISIDFSFSMRIKESFSLKTDNNAPWIVDTGKTQSVLRAPSALRTRAFRLPQGFALFAAQDAPVPAWGNLAARPEGQKLPLTGWLAPGLTVARDEWQPVPTADQQVACYVAMLFIDSVPPTTADTTSSAARAAGESPDKPFETLAKMVFRWVVAAVQGQPHDAAYIDTVQLSDVELAFLLDTVLVSSDANPTPIPPQAASDFMQGQFTFTAKLPSDGVGPDTTYFPVPGALKLTIPPYPTPAQPGGAAYPGYGYTFGGYNQVSEAKLKELRAYFDALAVQVQEEMDREQAQALFATEDGGVSMAEWMFADYFLLLARQTTQAARDALRTFKYPIAAGDTPAGIVAWANTTGELAGDDALTLLELFTANATHPLNPSAGTPLTVGVTAALAAAASFNGVAAEVGNGMTGTLLAGANAAQAILVAGTQIHWVDAQGATGAVAHTVAAGDTLGSITALLLATNLGFTYETLLTRTDVLQAAGLLAQGAVPLVPATVHAVLSGDSFTTVAALPLYGAGFDAPALARRNAGRPVLHTGAQVKRDPTDPAPYVVQARNTLADVAAGLEMTLDQLLSGTAVLTQADLLAPAAQLALPTFPYTPASKDETLESVAARFGIALAVLAEQDANGRVPDLFATTTAGGVAEPFLDLTHLARFPVGELLKEAQRSNALQQLSGMAARYNLHGLRIPAASGITPLAGGMWVKGAPGSYTLPAQAGLFALTGQQFPLPDLGGQTQELPITFDRTAGPAWLLFNDAAGNAANTLSVTLKPASTDKGDQWTVQRVLNLTAFARAGRADVALERLGAEAVVTSELSSYPFTAQVEWQSAGSVNLPYGASTGAVQQLRLWTVPNAMLALPDPATRAVNPRFSVEVARYDEGTGATVRAAPGPYGWATVIPFTVKRVPAVAGSAAVEETYELVGADGGTIVLLERLLDQVQSDDALIEQLVVGYAPDQSGGNAQGIQTDEQGAVTMGIAQVNLSTVTRPPGGGGLMLFAAQEPAPEARLLNTPTAFLRLIWEASITRAGGFYLYYYDTADGRGLPERVFNDRNETVLSVVVLWAAGAAGQQNRLTNYMTSVVTGEAIDTSSSVLFAQANPPTDPVDTVTADGDDSLESLAYASYSDVGDLAALNAGAALSAAVEIQVTEGLTQAPPGGISLAGLANDFGTSVADLQLANGGTLADPVQFPTAVLLPPLTLKPGTSASSGSLGAIADYYGESLTALAAHNRAVAGLWAGQTVKVPGGPRVRNATVPPGVASVAALRTMPAPVPQDPTVPAYGQLAALNAYSLLQPTVLANRWFTASDTGLAAGPVTVPADALNADKIRAPRALVEGDDWDYRRSLPFAKFAQNPPADQPGLPPASASPYLGVGGVLQVTFDWLDYYGNALVTTLSTPLAGDAQPWNDPPVRTGYTDALVGLSQWPSVSSSWQVAGAAGAAQLRVALGFDPSRYQGLITASSSAPTTVTAVFTDALDPASAITLANYALAPGADVTAASLSQDGKTVTLTVSPLGADEGYTLSVQNLKLAADANRTLQGRAEFLGTTVLTSTVQENAAKDQRVYTSLFYQLTDALGIGYTLASPVLKAGKTDVPPAQVTALLAWLFTGSAPILGFIADRAAFGTGAATPAATQALEVAVAAPNDAEIFELWLDFGIARLGGAVAGDLETQAGIRSAATRVAPLQKALAGTAGAGSSGTLGLDEFAASYETALSGGGYRMTVATGTDRFETGSTASAAGSVWSVRLGTAAPQPIGYQVTAATQGAPDIYAPRPISNELQSRTGVPIRSYTTGTGLSEAGTPTDFSDIDMDVWGRTLFGAVDRLLTPQFTAAIQLVGELYTTPTDFLKEVLGEYTPEEVEQGKKGGKKSLAGIASEWMIPVFDDQAGAETKDVVEAYRQQLLVRLANAYAVRAGVRFAADVWASVPEPVAPRLFGSVGPAGVSLQAATVESGGATVVTLDFTGPLQPGPAADAASYTVTGGPPATSATVSADATVVTLQMAGPVTAGTTRVTVGAAVKDAAGRPLRQPATRVVTVGAADLASTISFTSPKLALQTGTQPLPFLVTAPEIVLGSTGEVVSSVPMDLAYEGSSIEHQIGSLEGIDGYQASSWLSFALAGSRAPLRTELGQFELPMVLRSFPATPALPSQTGTASAPDCGVPLAELTEWDYRFTWSLPFHYPQDRVHGLVEFNLQPPAMLLAGFEDAFAQMAQFVTTIPQVQDDFDSYLAGIDATTDRVADADKVKNAAVALQSFITMVDGVVDAAAGNAMTMVAARSALVGDASLDYAFTVQEGAVDVGATQGALLVTLLGALPAGIAAVTVEIDPAQYTAQPYLPGDGPAADDAFAFVFLKNGTTTEYLTAADGQAKPDRTVVLQGMDVLQRQDAWSTVQVKRNEILAGKAVAEPFVYTTPRVKFADPLFPTLDQDCPIDLSLIGSTGGTPVARPLDAQLNGFFDALLEKNTQPTLTFQVEVTYEYRINAQLGPVQLPVFMQAPLTVQVKDAQTQPGAPSTREEMVEQWTQAITRWFTAYTPACGGTLKLDLTAMSDLTEQPMPLLRLSNLQLPTAWVQNPALPCLQNTGG